MEIPLAIALIIAAWIHGYRRGVRKNAVVEMSARDLRRELRRRK